MIISSSIRHGFSPTNRLFLQSNIVLKSVFETSELCRPVYRGQTSQGRGTAGQDVYFRCSNRTLTGSMSQELQHDDDEQTWGEKRNISSRRRAMKNYRAYTPQLMDTQEMQALRNALNRSEMQIQQQGHMQEYIPRKPASNKLRQWYGLPRNHRAINRPTMSAGPSSRLENSDTSNQLRERPATSKRSTCNGPKAGEFATILKKEARQVRGVIVKFYCFRFYVTLMLIKSYFSHFFLVELERRYEDTKRSLLDVREIPFCSYC
ncbi:hypothetical protein GQ600_5408 [Phytophthora cactorum]|nr:hypothetical protein GQ600_5408 [Phytophthora cactorum]